MKKLLFVCGIIFGIGFLGACSSSSDKGFIYSSSDCNEVKRDCLNKCRQAGKGQNTCLSECEKARGMCEAVKTKGCLQDCNLRFGKDSPGAEQCKKRCQDKG
ncbi:MAG: hypothetical protein SOW25_04085 [Helicobacter sp.]|nr:hypothetical protein [Helicobacter sp.]